MATRRFPLFPSHFTLTAKFAAISTLLVGLLAAVATMAWLALPSGQQGEGELSRLSQAKSAVQSVDMMHDALRAHLLQALLVGQSGHLNKLEIGNEASVDAQTLRTEWAKLRATLLPAELQATTERIAGEVVGYAKLTEALIEQAVLDRPLALARMPEFQTAFEATRTTLAELTTELAALQQAALEASTARVRQARQTLLLWAGLAALAGWVCVWLMARSIQRSLFGLRDVAVAIAAGDLEQRSPMQGEDEVGQLANAVNRMAHNLQEMIERLRQGAERAAFAGELSQAMEMADDEPQAHAVVARTMALVSPHHAMELLLADASDSHLHPAALHPTQGAAGCSVVSPAGCIAVRRGRPQHFDNSESISACPRLRDVPGPAKAAHCAPVTFMGQTLGVLHATGPVHMRLSEPQLDRLTALALQTGARIGTVRAFEQSRLQASTDSLTGLPNRRTAEGLLRRLMASQTPFVMVMCDLDRFKRLNDTYGHSAGDDALRTFSEVARANVREGDLCARWGGEEFAFVLSQADSKQALAWIQRLRELLAQALVQRSKPIFTASFGVAAWEVSETPEVLVQRADAALYRAKSEGRDRAVLALTPLSHSAKAGLVESPESEWSAADGLESVV